MTNREPTPADAVLVAIDISKLRNDVLIELPGAVRRKRLTVLNTKTEHDRFVGLLGNFGRPVIAGFEATVNYHRPLAHRLLEAGIQELSKTHEVVSKAKTELWDRLLTHYLQLYFPEIARFAGNSRSDWFLAFLEQFPTPASITAFAKEEFVSAALDVVGKKAAEAAWTTLIWIR